MKFPIVLKVIFNLEMKYSSIGVELKKKTRLSHLSQSFIFQPTGSVDFLTSDVRILRNSVHLQALI